MGTFIGHIAPGGGFLFIGLWHLYNTIHNYVQGQWSFQTRPWFPLNFQKSKLRYLELYAIMLGSCASIAGELHFGLHGRSALDRDWSIPYMNLNNFEHSTISLFFLIYAAVAFLLDILQINMPHGLIHVLGALAFSQELLIFHQHSADHMGLEGQYHWLLQLIIIVSMAATLLEIPWPQSFLVALVRSMSIFFQGCWFIQMAFIVWTRSFIPKGCFFDAYMVICKDKTATVRAKALANLQFSWYLAGVIVFSLLLYSIMFRVEARRTYQQVSNQVENNTMEGDAQLEECTKLSMV